MMEAAKDSLDIGILVGDITASLNFYQNILGLKLVDKRPLWFGTMYLLQFGSSDLKLIVPEAIPPKGPVGVESQLGLRYVTFVVKNLGQLSRRLQKEGVEFALPEREIRPGVRVAMVKDPEDNIVEFVQRS